MGEQKHLEQSRTLAVSYSNWYLGCGLDSDLLLRGELVPTRWITRLGESVPITPSIETNKEEYETIDYG